MRMKDHWSGYTISSFQLPLRIVHETFPSITIKNMKKGRSRDGCVMSRGSPLAVDRKGKDDS